MVLDGFRSVWKGLEGFGRGWDGWGGVGRGGEGWGGGGGGTSLVFIDRIIVFYSFS